MPIATTPPSQDPHPFHWHGMELEDQNFQIQGNTRFVLFAVVFLAVVLFFVVLFAVVFHVTLVVCRFINRQRSSSQPPPHPLRVVGGLEKTAIDTLPVTLYRSMPPSEAAPDKNGVEENECCICLGEFIDGDKVKILPRCQHSYHCECVDRWLRTRSSCPLCRNSIRVHSVVPPTITQ